MPFLLSICKHCVFAQILNPNLIIKLHTIEEYFKFKVCKLNYSNSNTGKGPNEIKRMIDAHQSTGVME